jgi:hypothetical protein
MNKGGRPKVDISTKKNYKKVVLLYDNGLLSLKEAAILLGTTKSTFNKKMKERSADEIKTIRTNRTESKTNEEDEGEEGYEKRKEQ